MMYVLLAVFETTRQGFYLISWDFKLLTAQPKTPHAQPASPVPAAPSQDIGFCILAKNPDGTFPQLKPYM